MVFRPGLAAMVVGGIAAACAPVTPQPSPGPATTSATTTVAVRENLSGRFIALIGPKAQHDPMYLDTPGTNFFCLRSFIDRQSGEIAHQLYVAASYDQKREWDTVRDSAGLPLPFIPISRYPIACDGKNNCSYAEEFAATIPEGELRANPSGLAIIFSDRAGNAETINVSAKQIGAQLAAVEAHKNDRLSPPQSTASQPAVAPQSAAHQPE